MQLNYIKGDATSPIGEGNKIIAHVCNDIGGWGRGFVLALSKRWSQPENEFKKWFKSGENFSLGEVIFVQVEKDCWVANMIGQHDIKSDKEGIPPVRYEAIGIALSKVAVYAKKINASVHLPRIGCGLAGGTWDKMEPVIIQELAEKGVPVTVYDL
ncbi:MAG: macro domain-containing protein [Niastella sp.]|uniref:macro domain-containing protein n=1 Tax=Niastella sp. TaxID=1869183 RepID=UPI00389AE8F2